MKVNVYKMEIQVLDFEKYNPKTIIQEMEDCDHVSIKVRDWAVRSVDWDDDHPLNKGATADEAFKQLFSDETISLQAEYNKALDQEIDFD